MDQLFSVNNIVLTAGSTNETGGMKLGSRRFVNKSFCQQLSVNFSLLVQES